MVKNIIEKMKECCKGGDNCCKGGNAGSANTVYGMGFVGAAFYFLTHAATFNAGVMGILKAIVWPAILVYKALELLHF